MLSTFHTLPALYVAYQLGYNFDRFEDWVIELAMIILGINALVANLFELKTMINESKQIKGLYNWISDRADFKSDSKNV